MRMATLTLGPVYFLWDGPKWRDFYKKIAHEAPIARVVIGETICSKRNHFTAPYMEEVIVHLERAGKEVARDVAHADAGAAQTDRSKTGTDVFAQQSEFAFHSVTPLVGMAEIGFGP